MLNRFSDITQIVRVRSRKRVDVFALGICTWEMLTMERLFDAPGIGSRQPAAGSVGVAVPWQWSQSGCIATQRKELR